MSLGWRWLRNAILGRQGDSEVAPDLRAWLRVVIEAATRLVRHQLRARNVPQFGTISTRPSSARRRSAFAIVFLATP